MADFVWDPLRIGAMLLLGSTTVDLNVPSAASLTLTGLAPTLSFQLAEPSAGSLTLAGNTPSVSLSLGVSAPGALTLSGQQPNLTINLVVPTVSGLTLTGLQPSLSIGTPAGGHILIGPQVGVRIGPKIDSGVGE